VRIAQEIANDKTEANIRKCGDQIFGFYQKIIKLPYKIFM
jgi:hypothetical protein